MAENTVLLLERGSNDVEQLCCDGGLTCLVVHEREVVEQLVGIVGGCLHGDDAGGVLGCQAVEYGGVEPESYALGQQRLKELLAGGLDDVIVLDVVGCGIPSRLTGSRGSVVMTWVAVFLKWL